MAMSGFHSLMNQIRGTSAHGGSSFLPDEYIRRRADRRNAVVSLLLFIVVMTGVVGAFVVTNRQWISVRAEQAQVAADFKAESEKIRQLEQLEDQRAEMIERAIVATSVIERVPRSILLAEIINRLPERTAITDVTMTSRRINDRAAGRPGAAPTPASMQAGRSSSGPSARTPGGQRQAGASGKAAPAREPERPPQIEFTLVIQGLAVSDAHVADFQTALRGVELLSGVELIESRDSVVNDVTLKDFRIEARILPGADVRQTTPLRVARAADEPGTPDRRPQVSVPAP
jgi:Tfp pilus assembly protein PilN